MNNIEKQAAYNFVAMLQVLFIGLKLAKRTQHLLQ